MAYRIFRLSTTRSRLIEYELILNGRRMQLLKFEICEPCPGRIKQIPQTHVFLKMSTAGVPNSCTKLGLEKIHILEQLPNSKSVQIATLINF